MMYFFILGRHPELSSAEIKAALTREGVRAQFRHTSSEALVVETTAEILPDFFYGLGGSVKWGKIVATSARAALRRNLTDVLRKIRSEGKFSFGISAYPLEDGVKVGALRRELGRVGMQIKTALKRQGPVRFVTSRESTLSSVVVKTNQATEVVALQGKEKLLIGVTLAVQAFDDLSFRDYGRPGRSARSGMLPPKLARIMINLAQCPRDGALLDPFCGSGTVVTEAMLMGYQNITGADMDPQAVRATLENVAWIRSHYPEPTAHAHVRIIVSRAEEIGLRMLRRSVAAVVTEPTLGIPRTGSEPRNALEARARELALMYRSALQEFGHILARGGRVVMVIPTFVAQPNPVRIDVEKMVSGTGLRQVLSLTYRRERQWVAREITVFDRM